MQSLAAVGTLETELAVRVALCLWRLRRLTSYEIAVTCIGLEEVEDDVRTEAERQIDFSNQEKPAPVRLKEFEKELAEKRELVADRDVTLRLLESLSELSDNEPIDGDDVYGAFVDIIETLPAEIKVPDPGDEHFLATIGVPADEHEDGYDWSGWTAAMVKRGLAIFAETAKEAPAMMLARAVQVLRKTQEGNRPRVTELERNVRELRRRTREQEHRLRQRRLLPDGNTLDKITRYEAHLSRQMLQALHTLERLQAARAGQSVTPPAALDVTVDTPLPQLPFSQAAAVDSR